MKFTPEDITVFLICISVMLLCAKLLGEMFAKFNQPSIMGEILAGVILGPTVLGNMFPFISGYLFPQTGPVKTAVEGLTTLAVIFLLLVSGLELELGIVLKQGKKAISTGIFGIIIPFALGFAAAYLFPSLFNVSSGDSLIFALFLGTALSISALPVIAKTLMDLNIFKTKVGSTIMAAAMFNDLIGWLIFSVILGMLNMGGHGFSIQVTLILIIAFALFMLIIGRRIFNFIIPHLQNKISYPGGILNFIFITGLAGAAFTEYIGVHAIFGAFFVGIAIGDSVHLKEETRELIQKFVTNIFAPLFFVSIGLRVNFVASFNLEIVAFIIVLAFLGKLVGCSFGSYIAGSSFNESLIIGFGMNSRGAMEIILGLLALEAGLINEEVFVALVIMALFTSIASAPLMSLFIRKKKEPAFLTLLNPKNILFTDKPNKELVIKELINCVVKKDSLRDDFYKKVIEREAQVSTGIANYLAIPHARVKIESPLIAAAINKSGLDFDAPDGVPSRIVVLLLTPEDNNSMQLQLLSDIVKYFRDKGKIEDILNAKTGEEFIAKLKQSSILAP